MNPPNNISFLLEVDSILLATLCALGFLIPRLVKDEDVRYGLHAVIISFLLGFITNALIFFIINK